MYTVSMIYMKLTTTLGKTYRVVFNNDKQFDADSFVSTTVHKMVLLNVFNRLSGKVLFIQGDKIENLEAYKEDDK
jgi:hypothetical protein